MRRRGPAARARAVREPAPGWEAYTGAAPGLEKMQPWFQASLVTALCGLVASRLLAGLRPVPVQGLGLAASGLSEAECESHVPFSAEFKVEAAMGSHPSSVAD